MPPKKKAASKSVKKAIKKTMRKKSGKPRKKVKLSAGPAPAPGGPANLSVDFFEALGMVTATLFEHLTGAILGHDSLSVSGMIVFNNAGLGDTISVNGTCPGTAKLKIDVPTSPSTPVERTGNINDVFIIL